MPKCVVVESAFTWGDDKQPRTPWNRTVIYECHVKGMTMRHPTCRSRSAAPTSGSRPIRSSITCFRWASPPWSCSRSIISSPSGDSTEQGLVNYWGYKSIGFFAPDVRYATGALGQQVSEFKSMVKRLHRAGIEVILDVVYNHTAEGNHLGPTLCFRGIDNSAYYRLEPDHPRFYADYTGCGNTLDLRHSRTLQLVMDSLRYWVSEMHVDGFRFDLAPVLARESDAV